MNARAARGQGLALATVRNSLIAVPEGTHVRAQTGLETTGLQAQFGEGVLDDVGGRILEEVTARLERRIAAQASQSSDVAAGRGALSANGAASLSSVAKRASEDVALDLNRVLASSL